MCYTDSMDEEKKRYDDESRLAVTRRDRGRCIICGNLYDDVHEIIPRAALPGRRNYPILFSEKNRCCICRACHQRVPTVWGRVMLLGIMALKYGYKYNELPFRKYFEVRPV
jgi:5-methylcytosine-specific restriction endonuclease McrA